ncbi:MAG: 4-hydroxythreonine-4-phosphate dehydrogenase PdxA [Candidatus Bathyarchaeota archaeon]|nr:MAG: 4-hydroxythreonine-4-phosphate dehydrogenase PdxA [Candidatus Bathyarchaeota archaeon]
MGDAAGIGPEITIRSLLLKEIYHYCRPIVIGDVKVLSQERDAYRLKTRVRAANSVSDARFEYGTIDLLDLNNIQIEHLKMGEVQAMAGKAAYEYIEKGVQLALDGEIHGIVTAPINKEALNKGGHYYQGHTEILAKLTETKRYAMMLIAEELKVVHVTTHIPLGKVAEQITKKRVMETIELADQAMKTLGNNHPKIGVAGLNPHSSDGGLFGDEERTKIEPAVTQAIERGINAEGPVPADTLFLKTVRGVYDVAIAMYHDQGHIPVKLLGFEAGVNMTLGLPIIRTSVDHGTAFRHARERIGANPDSLIEAIRIAAKTARAKYSIAEDSV